MQEQSDALINKLILGLRSLAIKLERFVAITEDRMNHRASKWFYDHAKAHDQKFKSLCFYALITPENTTKINRLFGISTTTLQQLRKRSMFSSYWIDESDSDFLNDIIDKLDREKAKWAKYKKFDIEQKLRKSLDAFLKKEPEEIAKYLKNDIDDADLIVALNEVNEIYKFINIAIEKIPQEYWTGETKAFSDSIKTIAQFLNTQMYQAWISSEIKKTVVPEIAYMQKVFGFQTSMDDHSKSLLDFMQIDDSKIIEYLESVDSRLKEIKQMLSKFSKFCNDLNNKYVVPNFMLHEKMDANGVRRGLYIDDVVKDLEVLSARHDWLKLVLDKAKKMQAIVETLKKKYDPEDVAQVNEFLCEIKIAKAIIDQKLSATYDYKMCAENSINKKGQEKSDVDFKIDTPDGSILLEVTTPRKSDFVKRHTHHTFMSIGDRVCPATESVYPEIPELIKAQNVILNKCTKRICLCHKKAIHQCPDKTRDKDTVVVEAVEPIKFSLKKQDDTTLHVIVIFEKDLFDGAFDIHDYHDCFFYGASPKQPGLLCRNDDAARIFQERIDSVCFVKKTNNVFVYYHPRFNNQNLKSQLEQMLSHIGNVNQINIDQELNKLAAKIQEVRKSHNLSVQKLAAFINTDVKSIESLESKKIVSDEKDCVILYKVWQILRINRGE